MRLSLGVKFTSLCLQTNSADATQVSSRTASCILRTLHSYFFHMKNCPDSLLTRILGLHAITGRMRRGPCGSATGKEK